MDDKKIENLIHKIKGTKSKKIDRLEIPAFDPNSGKEWLTETIKKLGYKKNSEKLEEIIDKAVRSNMFEKYTKNGSITLFDTNLIEDYHKLSFAAPDHMNWCIFAQAVLLYQSLGDTLGYRNGKWEFNHGNINASPDFINELIYEFIDLGGVNDISIKNWNASDDTILYLITAAVIGTSNENEKMDVVFTRLRDEYIHDIPLLETRHPGDTTMNSLELQKSIAWNKLPYNVKSIGAGAAMRTGFIGVLYPGVHNRKKIIKYSIECARITHNSTIAYLGSIVSALFTAYAMERVDINKWPHKLLKLLNSNMIGKYIHKSRPHELESYTRDKIIFIGKWEKYVKLLFNGINPKLDLKFMRNPVERFRYLVENFSKGCDIPGSCGDDCVIFAYDAFLRCDGVLEKLIVGSILHTGDSDTIGSIAFSWFGAFYHTQKNNIIVGKMFSSLELINEINTTFVNVLSKISVAYYTDIYRSIATKYLINYVRNNN